MKKQTLIIRDPAAAAALTSRLIAVGFEKPIQVVISNVTQKRSLSQNDTYWMWMSEIALDQGNHKDHCAEFYREEFCPEKEVTVGGITKWVKSTKLLTKEEMSEYMNHILGHAATELNVFVTHPDDIGRTP